MQPFAHLIQCSTKTARTALTMEGEASDQDYQTSILLISKSRLKSSINTSTLMAGFALVSRVTGPLHII